MRRSVLVRFLGLSLAVALGAVIATALIATYSTSETLQGELDEKSSQLQVDGDIYTSLAQFAGEQDSWAGVDRLVRRLADETGRRIAVTKPDGTVIADSARRLGAEPELPSLPAATIDARNSGGGGLFVSSVTAVAKGRLPLSKAAATGWTAVGSSAWGLTESERQRREELTEQARACFRAKGKDASIVADIEGIPTVAYETPAANGASTVVSGPKATSRTVTDPCFPPALQAPSEKARVVNQDQLDRSVACLKAAGLKYKVTSVVPGGLRDVMPADEKGIIPDGFFECTSTARAAALAPYVAPEAKLYLGAKSTFNVFSAEGLLRTAATALGVLLIAALVMVFAGRRLVRPILALTGAAQRMTNGDHAARVPVSGRDEVARLGHAFNAMAESIQHHDFQRKAMVSDVAHELRTPLANIKGYLVASEDGVVPLDRELISSLLEEAGLLERLVVDLQDLALADAGKLRMHPDTRDLSELVEQVVAAHRPAAEAAGVTLTAAVSGPAPAIVDGARIRQALGNLVSNAIRFSPRGDSSPGGDRDGKVVVGVRRVGDCYKLTVTDNGTGIAEEHLPHLFDRFYRAEHSRSRTTGGSGLGLAITKHLVEAHDGTITVTSTLGYGSTFTIQLPTRPAA